MPAAHFKIRELIAPFSIGVLGTGIFPLFFVFFSALPASAETKVNVLLHAAGMILRPVDIVPFPIIIGKFGGPFANFCSMATVSSSLIAATGIALSVFRTLADSESTLCKKQKLLAIGESRVGHLFALWLLYSVFNAFQATRIVAHQSYINSNDCLSAALLMVLYGSSFYGLMMNVTFAVGMLSTAQRKRRVYRRMDSPQVLKSPGTSESNGREEWIALPVALIFAVAALWCGFCSISVSFESSPCERVAVAADRVAWMRKFGLPKTAAHVILYPLVSKPSINITTLIEDTYTSGALISLAPANVESQIFSTCRSMGVDAS